MASASVTRRCHHKKYPRNAHESDAKESGDWSEARWTPMDVCGRPMAGARDSKSFVSFLNKSLCAAPTKHSTPSDTPSRGGWHAPQDVSRSVSHIPAFFARHGLHECSQPID